MNWIGGLVLNFLIYLGELVALGKSILDSFLHGKLRFKLVIQQIAEIGFHSQPVVIITGAFTGAVLAAQSLFQFKPLGMETLGGALVSVSMLRELGPSITALMLAGRVGASMAAEIGTMKVTEQIDALESMDIHPIDYLVTPRFIAISLAMPLLIAESAAFGILASLVVGVGAFQVNGYYWINQMTYFTNITDIIIAVIKGSVFGILIVIISCHQGLKVSQGAVGVGRSTTRSMVFSSLAILIINFLLTLLLNIPFPIM